MNKKHVPVTDMTFVQLYDAVASGEEFYHNNYSRLEISAWKHLVSHHLSQESVIEELDKGNITRLVEAPSWTDQLDGTYDRGVWCFCDNSPNSTDSCFTKIIYRDSNGGFRDSNGFLWENAEPLSVELSSTLESIRNKSLT